MSGLAAGKMDRPIVIETPTVSQNTIGEAVESWATFITLFAEIRPLSSAERNSADAVRLSNVTRFITRFIPNLSSTMRILYSGRYYKITGFQEIGRRVGMDITAEALE